MLASTTLTAMLARRVQLEVVVMPPAAWSAREIEQALATLAALAQISTPSAAHFLKSAMARDGGLGHVRAGVARPDPACLQHMQRGPHARSSCRRWLRLQRSPRSPHRLPLIS